MECSPARGGSARVASSWHACGARTSRVAHSATTCGARLRASPQTITRMVWASPHDVGTARSLRCQVRPRSLRYEIRATCKRLSMPARSRSKVPDRIRLEGICCALRGRSGTPPCDPPSVAEAPSRFCSAPRQPRARVALTRPLQSYSRPRRGQPGGGLPQRLRCRSRCPSRRQPGGRSLVRGSRPQPRAERRRCAWESSRPKGLGVRVPKSTAAPRMRLEPVGGGDTISVPGLTVRAGGCGLGVDSARWALQPQPDQRLPHRHREPRREVARQAWIRVAIPSLEVPRLADQGGARPERAG